MEGLVSYGFMEESFSGEKLLDSTTGEAIEGEATEYTSSFRQCCRLFVGRRSVSYVVIRMKFIGMTTTMGKNTKTWLSRKYNG